jgi:hypothetical protein
MFLPREFVLADAINCGQLIDQAYAQYQLALQPAEPAWVIQDGYTLNGAFSALENARSLPFGFVASKNSIRYIVIRGTQTPLEWFDDASIRPAPFRNGWGNTTTGFLSIHEQIFPTIRLYPLAEAIIGACRPILALTSTGDHLDLQWTARAANGERITTASERASTTTVNNIEHLESNSFNGIAVINIYLQLRNYTSL